MIKTENGITITNGTGAEILADLTITIRHIYATARSHGMSKEAIKGIIISAVEIGLDDNSYTKDEVQEGEK